MKHFDTLQNYLNSYTFIAVSAGSISSSPTRNSISLPMRGNHVSSIWNVYAIPLVVIIVMQTKQQLIIHYVNAGFFTVVIKFISFHLRMTGLSLQELVEAD